MSGYWPEGDLGDDCDGDIEGYDGPDPLQKLYDDPAVVQAMDVLKRHHITGVQFDLWCATRDHARLGRPVGSVGGYPNQEGR